MRFFIPGLALVVLATSAPALARGDIVVDAGRGPVTVMLPAGYNPAQPAPLVLLLHSYLFGGAFQESYMQFGSLVDSHGFVYAFPEGMVDSTGSPYWNATDTCCDINGTGNDDATYLKDLVDAIKAQVAIDNRRVHLIGHSNGGAMAYAMACKYPETFGSIAVFAGYTYWDDSLCDPYESVHVLHIHGTGDLIVSYFGGTQPLLGPYPGAVESIEQWATYNGCGLGQDNSAPNLNLDALIFGSETSVRRYPSNCAEGGSAELWTMAFGGHTPVFTGNFAPAVIDYLLTHPKPGLGENFCEALANSTGSPAIAQALGSTSVTANDLTLRARPMTTGESGIFYYGPLEIQAAFGNGVRCVGAGGIGITRLSVTQADAAGVLTRSVDLSMPATPSGQITVGSTWKFQAWFRDPAGGGAGFNLSDGLSIDFTP